MTDRKLLSFEALKHGLVDGAARNPLKRWPKYDPCFCGSGAKATFCCLDRQPAYIKAEDALELLNAMAAGEPGRQAVRKEFQRHADDLLKLRVEEAKKQNDQPKPEGAA